MITKPTATKTFENEFKRLCKKYPSFKDYFKAIPQIALLKSPKNNFLPVIAG